MHKFAADLLICVHPLFAADVAGQGVPGAGAAAADRHLTNSSNESCISSWRAGIAHVAGPGIAGADAAASDGRHSSFNTLTVS